MLISGLRPSSRIVFALFLAFFLTLPVYAEQKNESEIPTRETQASLQTDATAEQSLEKKRLTRAGKVTFGEIFADPDNVDLNLQYAQEQINEGRFLSAASALERILMINPELSQVRAFYAMVLFRVDNAIEAEREFNLALKGTIPPELHNEINLYLRKIRRGKMKTHLTLRQSAGFGLDSNRNAAPSSKQNLVSDTMTDLSAQNGKQRDTNFVNITGLDLSRDLGFQAGHQLLASFNYYLAEQTIVDSLDISSYQAQIGAAFKNRFLNVTPTYYFNHTLLSKETFLRTNGGSIALDRHLFKRFNPFAAMKLEHQDFQSIAENSAGHERRGNQLQGVIGTSFRINPNMNISIGYTLYVNPPDVSNSCQGKG